MGDTSEASEGGLTTHLLDSSEGGLTTHLLDSSEGGVTTHLRDTSEGGVTTHLRDMRESLMLAESLARASLMTSPAAKRRIAARNMEIGEDVGNGGYVPPKQLLLYLVRMGSFTSAPKILNDDTQDADVDLPERLSRDELLERCRQEAVDVPSLVKRSFTRVNQQFGDTTAGVRVLRWNVLSKVCGEAVSSPYHIRVLQWNILSQALGQSNDNFVCCPNEALEWANRRYHIVEEIVQYTPDIICLQEVDHFCFLQKILCTQGYSGMFFPKPDSPCLYLQGNNGPDGCAIFYRNDKFEMLSMETRILEVWRVQSNQVAVMMLLRIQETGQEVCVATTHLKARNGALLSTLRNEQGKDLLDFVNTHNGGRPVILAGDFNAEPVEPIYSTILGNRTLGLASAYTALVADEEAPPKAKEPPYTTWKIREEGEVCHTIDYIFYTEKSFDVEALLEFPTGEEIGEDRIPSFNYPSDHFSLVCDFRFKEKSLS